MFVRGFAGMAGWLAASAVAYGESVVIFTTGL